MTHPDRESAGFWDTVKREDVKRQGEAAIRRFIQDGLSGVSVTAVLIGAETASRDWVTYEIQESARLGKGIVGVYINGIRSQAGWPDYRGTNPLDQLWYNQSGSRLYLSQLYRTYDWVAEDGYANLGAWVEEAARNARL